MQATIDAFSIKPFTRALTCLSRYGEEVVLLATADCLTLSSTNSSKSAYARFKYDKSFFSRYVLPPSTGNEGTVVSGQLLTKALLSILKHRTVEKTVEKCELSMQDGIDETDNNTDNNDSLESKLILKLYCKHGVVKTHRLLLSIPSNFLAPEASDGTSESCITVGPRAVKEILEHFPVARGGKADPQLIWTFGEAEVGVQTMESSLEAKGKGQVSTELTISAEEFEVYNIFATPSSVAFHLREFNSTISFAESAVSPLDLRFTDPGHPLFVEVDGDNYEGLFVIATSQPPEGGSQSGQSQSQRNKSLPASRSQTLGKRDRQAPSMEGTKKKKINPVVHLATEGSLAASLSPQTGGVLQYSAAPPMFEAQESTSPLFLPSTQVLVDDADALKESGLGLERMTGDELAEMLDEDLGDGEFTVDQEMPLTQRGALEVEFPAAPSDFDTEALRSFVPLFDD